MNDIAVTNNLQSSTFDLQIGRPESINVLQGKLDRAEKFGTPQFGDFSDIEMIQWFLYRRKHLQEKNERTSRTVTEYRRELSLFINLLLENSAEIGLDVDDHIIEGSLLKSLQSRHLRRYQEWLAKASPYVKKSGSYSPATLERKTAIIKSFFHFLYDVGYIHEPVHLGLRIATVRKDDRPNRDMGPQEVIHLLEAFHNSGHTVMFSIVQVLTTTGLRNEEFCRLQVKDLKKDTILGGYYLDVLGKGNKRRSIPLKEKVVHSIALYRQARGVVSLERAAGDDVLFPTSTGRAFSPSYFSQFVKREIEKALGSDQKGLVITPHVFRHAFAIISNLNGAAPHDIMRSLGHEKLETTMIYLEKVFEKSRHAIHAWEPGTLGKYL